MGKKWKEVSGDLFRDLGPKTVTRSKYNFQGWI